jgi:hypothetical protein
MVPKFETFERCLQALHLVHEVRLKISSGEMGESAQVDNMKKVETLLAARAERLAAGIAAEPASLEAI